MASPSTPSTAVTVPPVSCPLVCPLTVPHRPLKDEGRELPLSSVCRSKLPCLVSPRDWGEGSHRTGPPAELGMQPSHLESGPACTQASSLGVGRDSQVAGGSPHTWQARDGFVGRTGSLWDLKALKSGRTAASHPLEGREERDAARRLPPGTQSRGLRLSVLGSRPHSIDLCDADKFPRSSVPQFPQGVGWVHSWNGGSLEEGWGGRLADQRGRPCSRPESEALGTDRPTGDPGKRQGRQVGQARAGRCQRETPGGPRAAAPASPGAGGPTWPDAAFLQFVLLFATLFPLPAASKQRSPESHVHRVSGRVPLGSGGRRTSGSRGRQRPQATTGVPTPRLRQRQAWAWPRALSSTFCRRGATPPGPHWLRTLRGRTAPVPRVPLARSGSADPPETLQVQPGVFSFPFIAISSTLNSHRWPAAPSSRAEMSAAPPRPPPGATF